MESEKEPILNRVANSSLQTIDLEKLYSEGERSVIDLKDFLYQGQILREKDFRDQLNNIKWSQYQNHFVAINCSADAIVPTWSYMLITIALQPYARKIVFGTRAQLEDAIFLDSINQINWSQYQGAKVVIKGCSQVPVPASAYVEVANRLRPIASSVMYGEPCSTVPLFKRPK